MIFEKEIIDHIDHVNSLFLSLEKEESPILTIRKLRMELNKGQAVLNRPPKTAEYLIYLLISRKNREVMLGDLEEDFQEVRKKFGLRKAKFHYWFQVLRSIPPLIGASVIKMVVASITKALKTTN